MFWCCIARRKQNEKWVKRCSKDLRITLSTGSSVELPKAAVSRFEKPEEEEEEEEETEEENASEDSPNNRGAEDGVEMEEEQYDQDYEDDEEEAPKVDEIGRKVSPRSIRNLSELFEMQLRESGPYTSRPSCVVSYHSTTTEEDDDGSDDEKEKMIVPRPERGALRVRNSDSVVSI